MGMSPVRRILHWGPLLALTVITVITVCTIMCDLQWWPVLTPGGALNMVVFLTWNVLTLYNFFCAAFKGPGAVPKGWRPEADEDLQNVQYCSQCESHKAPRSHHCRKCQSCVLKMDHHCPWINNCVGHFNHGYFSYFLFFAPCGCIHAMFILIPSMYRAINRNYYLRYGGEVPLVFLGMRGFIACMFAVGLSVGVIGGVWGLLFWQLKSIVRNETGIESWINDKAAYRDKEEGEEEFVFPYNLGRKENFKQVFHWTPRPKLNGLWWPVREGCNQFSLTIEQIKQKKEKRDRSIVYYMKEGASGSMCPITKGLRVFCCPPCTDEPRLRTQEGDRIMVTRWKKHWMYGDLLLQGDQSPPSKRRSRGWFPRRCALEDVDHENGPRYFGDVLPSDNGMQPHTPEKEKSQVEKKED